VKEEFEYVTDIKFNAAQWGENMKAFSESIDDLHGTLLGTFGSEFMARLFGQSLEYVLIDGEWVYVKTVRPSV